MTCRQKSVRVFDPNDPRYTAKVVKHTVSAFGGVGNLVFLEQNESVNQHTYFQLLCGNLAESFEKCNINQFMFTQLGLLLNGQRIVELITSKNNLEILQT